MTISIWSEISLISDRAQRDLWSLRLVYLLRVSNHWGTYFHGFPRTEKLHRFWPLKSCFFRHCVHSKSKVILDHTIQNFWTENKYSGRSKMHKNHDIDNIIIYQAMVFSVLTMLERRVIFPWNWTFSAFLSKWVPKWQTTTCGNLSTTMVFSFLSGPLWYKCPYASVR